MDLLQIKALSVKTHIGVHAWEERILQQLLIDIVLHTDVTACHDNLANTIDYDQLCQKVTQHLESNTFTLIETVAEQIAVLIKKEFHVDQLTVSVSKPHAVKNASNVCITIHR